MIKIQHIVTVLFLASCASQPAKPPVPEWTHQTSRMVDNGYIVYVGKGEAGRADDAQFKAEGLALEDLANECSVVPKGTRVEDRYLETEEHGYVSYTKIAVELASCDEATKAVEPEAIRKIANAQFTEQLKKYQDMQETGFREEEDGEPLEPPTVVEAAPAQGTYSDHVHFYMTRQYVAYQKEIVVLAPPTTYAPGSKEAVVFHDSVVPATQRIQGLEQKDPGLKSAPMAYHEVPGRPKMERPESLGRAAKKAHAKHEAVAPRPKQQNRRSENRENKSGKQRKKRRHF